MTSDIPAAWQRLFCDCLHFSYIFCIQIKSVRVPITGVRNVSVPGDVGENATAPAPTTWMEQEYTMDYSVVS